MRVVVVFLALVIGALSLSLVWTNQTQVETISCLREQNALLQALVEQERRLCHRLGAINQAYDRTLINVATWLGLDSPEALAGD